MRCLQNMQIVVDDVSPQMIFETDMPGLMLIQVEGGDVRFGSKTNLTKTNGFLIKKGGSFGMGAADFPEKDVEFKLYAICVSGTATVNIIKTDYPN